MNTIPKNIVLVYSLKQGFSQQTENMLEQRYFLKPDYLTWRSSQLSRVVENVYLIGRGRVSGKEIGLHFYIHILYFHTERVE